MKIAIYQPRASYYVGGAEIVALEQAAFLANRGHQVTLIVTQALFITKGEYFRNFCRQNPLVLIKFIKIPKQLKWIYQEKPGSNWMRWDLESLHLTHTASNYFFSQKFDVVAVHNVLDVLSVPSTQKIVLHLHGYPSKINYMHQLCFTLPKVFIADSQYIKHKWSQMIKFSNCSVATNGVRSDYFIPRPQIKHCYDALYLGRLVPVKGIEYFIEAVRLLKKSIPKIKIAIAGEGPEKNNLMALVGKLKLDQNIKNLGYIRSDNLVQLYNSSKMAVFPSYGREGILTTMLEASSCGVPVITTTACSMHEFLKHRKTGFLVKPKNSRAIALAIKEIYQNEPLRVKLGMNARREVLKRWDWKIKIKKIEQIYEKVSTHH